MVSSTKTRFDTEAKGNSEMSAPRTRTLSKSVFFLACEVLIFNRRPIRYNFIIEHFYGLSYGPESAFLALANRKVGSGDKIDKFIFPFFVATTPYPRRVQLIFSNKKKKIFLNKCGLPYGLYTILFVVSLRNKSVLDYTRMVYMYLPTLL